MNHNRSFPLTLRINVFGQFKSIGVSQIHVSGCDSKDETILSADELHDHVSDLVFNVRRLISHWYFSYAWKIYQSQVQNCRKKIRKTKTDICSEILLGKKKISPRHEQH